MLTVGGVVSWTAVRGAGSDVVVLPAPSRATAVSVCDALLAAAVFHETAYGAVVASTPRLAPSSLNWTPPTPTLSEALAVTVTVLLTVAPVNGAVRLTVGGVVSLNTVTVTAADVVVLPAPSRATAVSVCDALLAAVVFHETAYGAVVASTPRLAPSNLTWPPRPSSLPEALAVTVTVLLTVAPVVGAVRLTVGGVVSLNTVTVTAADVVALPAPSRAT